jgi:hypothetical protein
MDRWQRVMEAQLVERFTVAELAALARFYSTPEGQSVVRKLVAVTAAVTPILEAEIRSPGRGAFSQRVSV